MHGILDIFNVSNSNGNMEALERKIQCKKLMFRYKVLFVYVTVAIADTKSLKYYV